MVIGVCHSTTMASVLPKITAPVLQNACRRMLLCTWRPTKLAPALQTGCRLLSSSHQELWGDCGEYKQYLVDRKIALNKRLTDPNRFQKLADREDRSDLPVEAIVAQCKGKYFIHHRGCSIMKTADDMIIFNELLAHLKPATVIELGVCSGGSAVWIADMLKLMDVQSTVYSMDIDLSNIEECVKEIQPSNVHFLQGDSYEIEKTFTTEMIQSLPHPWLVIEDAHTNICGIMNYFGRYMNTGDYFVIEDLNPNLPCTIGYAAIYDASFVPAGPEALKDLKAFLNEHVDEFAVDSFYTDFFGYNGTWNMHGYIRKM